MKCYHSSIASCNNFLVDVIILCNYLKKISKHMKKLDFNQAIEPVYI